MTPKQKTPATNETQAQAVVAKLREMIVRGNVGPGNRLTEWDVAERFDVSRTPARQALQQLHAEGFLAKRSDTRRFELVVAPLTRANLREVYRLMGALESLAASGLAELAAVDLKRRYRELKTANDGFESIARRSPHSFERMFELHNRFHSLLVEGHVSPRLGAMIDALRPHVERYEWMYAPTVGPHYDDTFDEHAAILRAVRSGKAGLIERAVRKNWTDSAQRLLKALDSLGEKGNWSAD